MVKVLMHAHLTEGRRYLVQTQLQKSGLKMRLVQYCILLLNEESLQRWPTCYRFSYPLKRLLLGISLYSLSLKMLPQFLLWSLPWCLTSLSSELWFNFSIWSSSGLYKPNNVPLVWKKLNLHDFWKHIELRHHLLFQKKILCSCCGTLKNRLSHERASWFQPHCSYGWLVFMNLINADNHYHWKICLVCMCMCVCLHTSTYISAYAYHTCAKENFRSSFSILFPYKKATEAEGRALYYPYNYLTWSLHFAWTEQVVQD